MRMTGNFSRNRDLFHFNATNFSCPCSVARVELSQPGGGKKGKAKALYDFHGENEDELSFKVSTPLLDQFPRGLVLLTSAKK